MAALLTATYQLLGRSGEDPVAITGRVNYLQPLFAPVTRSTSVQYLQQMPDDAAAKISRYTAKAYSNNLGEIKTEKDVVQSVQTKGMQTNCYHPLEALSRLKAWEITSKSWCYVAMSSISAIE